jgi:hypothetical protein
MVRVPVGVDDEIGDEIRPGRLDEDMDFLGAPLPALGIADDPAHRVAGGDRTGADELLALLQSDVGDFSGRGIDLIERALGKWIDLHRIDVTGAGRLDPGRRIGEVNALLGIARLGCGAPTGERLELAWQRQKLGDLDDLDRLRRFCLQHGRLGRGVVVADMWRLEGAAGRECGRRQQA